MKDKFSDVVAGAQIVGVSSSDTIPEFLQDVFGFQDADKKERSELIKTYLGIDSMGESARTYKRYPSTFSRAISMAIENLISLAQHIERSQGKTPEGISISYSLDEDDTVFEDVVFGGEFKLDRGRLRAVVESSASQQQGLILFGPEGATRSNYISFSVYTRRSDKSRVTEIFEIVDKYVYKENPLKGKIINIYGYEEDFGDMEWDDIAIPPYFRQEVEENIIWPARYHDTIKAANLRVPRGVMLEGVRGMGKTLLSRIIANKIRGDNTFIKAKPSDVQRLGWEYVFDVAKTLEPSVLYIEDIETLTPSKQMLGILSTSLTDALDYLDGTEERSNVILLTSTNAPEMVDLGIIDRPGRIDRRLIFDPQNEDFGLQWKENVFRIHLRGHKLDAGLDVSTLARMISDHVYTGSHIEELIHTATLEALRKMGIDSLTADDVKEQVVLTESDFRKAKIRIERIIRRSCATPELS